VELYLGASDENISESYEQMCLPAFTGHPAEELRSLPSLSCLHLRYHHTTRASDILALGTLTGLTGLTALTIQGASRPEWGPLEPEDFDEGEGDRLQEANRPVALGSHRSPRSISPTAAPTSRRSWARTAGKGCGGEHRPWQSSQLSRRSTSAAGVGRFTTSRWKRSASSPR
jgi:hypothetical protein